MTTGKYRYYDGCLYMMCMLHLSGNFKAYLSTSSTSNTPVSTPANNTTTNNTTTNNTTTNNTTTNNTTTNNTTTNNTTTNNTTTGSTAAKASYDFASSSLPSGYPKYSGTISATITGGALVVTKTGGYSTPKITLPFSIGSKKLSDYSGIKLNVKGVSGDYANKQLYAGVGSTNLGYINNASIPNGSFGSITIPITGTTNTGDIEISFWLNNTNAYVIHIQSIELIPKP